ncbi:RmlC-like cupin domain-containing protein [Haematococcus lacustris]
MASAMIQVLGFTLAALAVCVVGDDGSCKSTPAVQADYSLVLAGARKSGIAFSDLPGFTRSVYQRDHALITPESRVWSPHPGWTNSLTSHLMSPASGASFSMFLAVMQAEGSAAPAVRSSVERFVLVMEGAAQVTGPEADTLQLAANHWVYFPPNTTARLTSSSGAGLLVWERVYAAQGSPAFQHGFVDDSPLLATPGEVFQLRKLLPQTLDYDFNIHVMDFQPGEHLNVKEIHYNQHGLMLLEGKGIYRLADNWYPVQAGDAVWMAPYVLQWYAALGTTRTRYIINKDTTVDPLFS